MIKDPALYAAMATGLDATHARLPSLGVAHWKLAMVAYDPDNPDKYLVLSSAGEETLAAEIVALINPNDAHQDPDYIPPFPQPE
jgi:hypothetical protein